MSESEERETVLEEIFGSSSSSEGEEFPQEDDNESTSPSSKSRTSRSRSQKRRTSKGKVVKKEGGISERVLEARRDFDDALEKIKSQGNRRRAKLDGLDPVDSDEMASSFRKKMEKAAMDDNDNVESGRPALCKHKMLDEIVEMLNRKHMHDYLLDCGILSAVRLCMEPMSNRSLPAVNLRKTLLEVLKSLPIDTDHLRESGIGRIVLFFANRKKENPEVQRLSKDLISRWSRPIVGDVPHNEGSTESVTTREGPRMLQSRAFELAERGDIDMSPQHKKMLMHLQKKAKSKKNI